MKTFKTVIVLVNYNNNEDTIDCVKSIQNIVDVDLPYIIIADNDSKIKTIETDLSFYPHLHVIYNQVNVGFGRANNLGIKWAQENLDFEFILLLNNDTIIEPNTISELITPFAIDNSIGITTAKTFYEGNRDIIWYGGGEIDYKRGWPKIYDLNSEASNEGANKSRYVTFVSGCTMMFTKSSISILKGFDNGFFMYCEDLELCIRALKTNFKLFYNSNAVVFHKVNASMKIKTKISGLNKANPNLNFQFYHKKINQYKTMKMHLSMVDFFKFNIHFWSKYIFQTVMFMFKGDFSFYKTSLKTFKSIIFN